ncbi:hypothetical protein CBR_g50277 [Chara braunii]|uniref:Uncharacterized protein n=1 Tax=Chara braunii TaxID=69332 RepID=A0A388M6S3_CHABU|nr:hypothetical protein CBR_g50277 [Chara braunii]|eukprot:GBG90183.1 hypothetical protein CBR_g50277 [Chara braunii]
MRSLQHTMATSQSRNFKVELCGNSSHSARTVAVPIIAGATLISAGHGTLTADASGIASADPTCWYYSHTSV